MGYEIAPQSERKLWWKIRKARDEVVFKSPDSFCLQRCNGEYVEEIWTCVNFGGFGVDGIGVEIVGNEDVLITGSRSDRETTGLIHVDLTDCALNLHEDIMCARTWYQSVDGRAYVMLIRR